VHELRTGRPGDQVSSPGLGKICLRSTTSIPVLGPAQSPIKWTVGALYGRVKRPGRDAKR
jgi:hypothetical protein